MRFKRLPQASGSIGRFGPLGEGNIHSPQAPCLYLFRTFIVIFVSFMVRIALGVLGLDITSSPLILVY